MPLTTSSFTEMNQHLSLNNFLPGERYDILKHLTSSDGKGPF